MKKTDLLALGLTEEQIKAVQAMHGDAIIRMKAKWKSGSDDLTRTAIIAMVPMLKDPKNLKQILATVNYLYHAENRTQRGPEQGGGGE